MKETWRGGREIKKVGNFNVWGKGKSRESEEEEEEEGEEGEERDD